MVLIGVLAVLLIDVHIKNSIEVETHPHTTSMKLPNIDRTQVNLSPPKMVNNKVVRHSKICNEIPLNQAH